MARTRRAPCWTRRRRRTSRLREHIDLDDIQGLLYTSATSGRPKGVLLSFGNHWWSAVGSALRLGVHGDDRWLAPLSLWHVGGLAIVWRSAIYGIPMVLHDAFDPAAVNREIDHGAVTLVSMVSVMLERVLAARRGRPFPPRLRCILLGGGPIPAALLAACRRMGAPVAATYGLTEAASQVATLGPDDAGRKAGSAGQPLLPTRVRIDANGRPAATGEVGEILVAGPTVMRGYAGRPDETRRALRDGWLHTGDLGYLDAGGDLYVVDRRDDLIITGGENVYPSEVEAVLGTHPAVADAAVVGVPDSEWGHAVGAAVVLRPNASASVDELRVFSEGRLARYKLPRHVWFMDALPRSPGGKLLRRSIREWIAAGAHRTSGRPDDR
jgi:O-succinylbenzoic acid--CoA ligase